MRYFILITIAAVFGLRTLLKSPGEAGPFSLDHIELALFGAYVGEVR